MACKSCCRNRSSVKKGRWTPEEDLKLRSHINRYGIVCWKLVPSLAGLDRCGKSCRLRWLNYLRPGLRTQHFSAAEIALILHMQSIIGNKWCEIAKHLPGRTDNQVKNYWNSYLKPRQQMRGTGHEIYQKQQQHHPSVPCPADSHGSNLVEEPAAELFHNNATGNNENENFGFLESCQEVQQQQQLDYWYCADDTEWCSLIFNERSSAAFF